jgi:ATP-binding cassette subfamily B protein
MTPPANLSERNASPPGEVVPRAWANAVKARLCDGESVLAHFETDLDAELRYASGLVVLTDRRVLAACARAGGEIEWRFFDLDARFRLVRQDHSGIGTLSLFDARRRIFAWRYTLGRDTAAGRLIDAFESLTFRRRPDASAAARGASAFSGVLDSPSSEPDPDSDPEIQTPPSTWGLFRLWRFACPYRARLFAGFLLSLASTGATLVPPYLTMPLMDEVLIPYQNGNPIDSARAAFYLVGLFGAALVAWILGWARTYCLAWVSERIGADLRIGTYEHLLALSQEYFGGKRTGDLIARIGSETDRINVFISLHFLDFATDVLMIAMTTCILVSIDAQLALVTLLPLPVIAWMIHTVREKLRLGFERVDRIWAEITNVLADTIPGIRVVKAFAQEAREAERFRAANRRNLEGNDKVNQVWSLFGPTVTFLTEIGILVVWAFGIWRISKDEITVGVLTAFIAYIGRFYTRLDSMSRIVSVTQKAAAGAKRIFDILDHVSKVPEPENPVHLEKIDGRIELSDAGFRYGTRNVIRHLNLSIEPGEMIGLVGHSGSGKSTLINLICRFYDVAEGAVKIGSVDIRDMSSDYLMSIVSFVFQDVFLFKQSIASNILIGNPQATRDDVVAAAKAAQCHEFIERLPQGYDTVIGTRNIHLSGGQRQRIVIARAMLKNAPIIVLDEATAFADPENEQKIQLAFEKLMQNKTVIIIAHRLSTVRGADKIVVVDRGRVVEEGRHDELVAADGAYRRMWEQYTSAMSWRLTGDGEGDDVSRATRAPGVEMAADAAKDSRPEAGNDKGEGCVPCAGMAADAAKDSRPEAGNDKREACEGDRGDGEVVRHV